jgi:TPP-dependent 2-oxoacid decarboxylase
MKKKILFLPLAVSILLGSHLSCPANPVSEAKEDVTPLTKSMEEMETAYKALGKALKSPDSSQKPAYLKLAAAVKAEAVKCKEMVPVKVAELPEGQKAAALEGYKNAIQSFIEIVGKLETALKAERWDEAALIMKELKEARADGHEKYKKDE